MKNFFIPADVFKLLKNASWRFGANGVEYAASFIQSILLARFLGMEGFGLFVLVSTYIVIVNKIVDFRVWEVVTKYVAEFKEKDDLPSALSMIKLSYLVDFLSGVLSFLFILFSAGWICQHVLHRPDVQTAAKVYALVLLISTTQGTSSAVLRVFDKFRIQGLLSAFGSVITLGFIVGALLMRPEFIAVFWAIVWAAVVNAVIMTFVTVKHIAPYFQGMWERSKISLLKDRFREMTLFLFHTSFNYLITLATKDIDVVILNYFCGVASVGVYQIAKKIARGLGFLADPLYYAVYPDLAKMWAREARSEIRRYLSRITGLTAFVVLILTGLLSLFGGDIINFVYGPAYVEAFPALRVMVWGTMIATSLFWMRPVLLSMGKPGVLTGANIFSAVTMFVLSLILVPKYGYMGSAVMFVYPYAVGHAICARSFFKGVYGA